MSKKRRNRAKKIQPQRVYRNRVLKSEVRREASLPAKLHYSVKPTYAPAFSYKRSVRVYRPPALPNPPKKNKPTRKALYSELVALEKKSPCRNRQVRKEVIHATGRAGGNVRPPKFTQQSKVRC